MFEFLDNLRAKPEHVKKRIALLSTLVVFFAIVNVWWVTKTSPVSEHSVAISEVVSPLGVVANVFMSAKGRVEGLGDEITAKFLTATKTPEFVPKDTRGEIVYPDQIFPDQNEEKLTATSSVN